MESPEDIEKALARLIPASLSEGGMRSMEELIDGLAAGEVSAAAAPGKAVWWPWIGGIGAVAAAVFFVVMPHGSPVATAREAVIAEMPSTGDELVLIDQSEVVAEAVPEDWMSEADGVPHRAWRVRVINHERLRDVKTGFEVHVSHPREEVRLMPVTSF